MSDKPIPLPDHPTIMCVVCIYELVHDEDSWGRPAVTVRHGDALCYGHVLRVLGYTDEAATQLQENHGM